jgi:hypothetical protein
MAARVSTNFAQKILRLSAEFVLMPGSDKDYSVPGHNFSGELLGKWRLKKKGKDFDLALRTNKLLREILSTGASQRVHPAMHPAFRILDVFIVKPFF